MLYLKVQLKTVLYLNVRKKKKLYSNKKLNVLCFKINLYLIEWFLCVPLLVLVPHLTTLSFLTPGKVEQDFTRAF